MGVYMELYHQFPDGFAPVALWIGVDARYPEFIIDATCQTIEVELAFRANITYPIGFGGNCGCGI